jgi:hypothetical protein
MAVVKPFRAVRYDEDVAGPLDTLVAPPYDVIDEAGREELMARSPFNVVHLTLPEDENDAARLWSEWQSDGAVVREDAPSFWALEQDYVGPDGVARTRRGIVASLKAEPYERGVVLPQAVRRVVPPLMNDFVSLQKDVALISILGPQEAFRIAQVDASSTFNYTPLIAAALKPAADLRDDLRRWGEELSLLRAFA